MPPLLALLAVPRQAAPLIAVVGIALVICGFVLERAPADSKWRRLAFGFITIAGSALCWVGAWVAFPAV
jgi:hypothetical protein